MTDVFAAIEAFGADRQRRDAVAANDTNEIKSIADLMDTETDRADTETGAPPWARMQARFKFNREGEINNLKQKLGTDVVEHEGELYFTNPQSGRLVKVNPDGIDLGDFMEFVPDALAAGLGLGAGALVAATAPASIPAAAAGALTLGGAAAGAGLGEVATQAVGAALPGDEGDVSLADRASDVGVSAALELVAPGLGKLGKIAVKAPGKAFSKLLATGTPEATRVGEAAGRLGINITSLQKSFGGFAGSLNKHLSQSPLSAGSMQKARLKSAAQMVELSDKTIANLAKKGTAGAFDAASAAYDQAVLRTAGVRAQVGEEMFSKFEKAAGNEPIFDLTTIESRINDIVDRTATLFTGSKASAIRASLDKQKEEYLNLLVKEAGTDGDKFGMVTGRTMKKLLSAWSKNAADPREVLDKVLDSNTKKFVAQEIYGELIGILDNTIKSGGVGGEAATLLKDARNVYKKTSDMIRELGLNPLGEKVFTDNPDTIYRLFTTRGNERKVRNVMRFLNKNSPDTARDVRLSVFQRMVDDATSGPDEIFNPKAFARVADKSKREMKLLFAGEPALKGLFNDFVRVADKLGPIGGSQTEFQGQMGRLLSSVSGSLKTTGLFGAGAAAVGAGGSGTLQTVLAEMLTSKAIASAITEPVLLDNYTTILKKVGSQMGVIADAPPVSEVTKAVTNLASRTYAEHRQREQEATGQTEREKAKAVRRMQLQAKGL